MTDGLNEVKFSFKKDLMIQEGDKYKEILKDKRLHGLGLAPIFEAIDKLGKNDNKVTDGTELEYLEKLSQKLGDEIDEGKIKELVKEFKELKKASGGNPVAAVIKLLSNTEPPEVKIEEKTPDDVVPKEVAGPESTIKDGKLREEPAGEETPATEEHLSDDGKTSQRAFNQAIQTTVTKLGTKKDELTAKYTETYKAVKGDNLYKIAVRTLKQEGIEKPNWKQINERIAEIALVNNIKDVNRILVGQEIKLPKTGGTEPPAAGTEPPAGGTEPPAGRTEPAAFNPESNVARDAAGESSVKVTDNFDPEGWTASAVAGEADITKYTKKEGEGESAVTKEKYAVEVSGVTIVADTLEGVKALKQEFEANQPVGKPEGEESPEDAAKRKDLNLDKLKSQMSLLQNTEDVILYVIDQLKNPDITDSSSDKFKALVLDLLKTGDPEVVEKLMLKDYEFDSTLFTKDEVSFKTAADMYKAIRDKELRGERLSDTEHSLKYTFQTSDDENGFKIEADTEKGVVEKYMGFDENGDVYYYYSNVPPVFAYSQELLDEFAAKLNSADTDVKKSALFKEYVNTPDPALRMHLAYNTEDYTASKEDIETLINNSDLETLSCLYVKDEYKAELYKKAAEKAKELFLADKGNLDNARYLYEIFDRIDESGLSEAEKNAIKTEILESYFTVTTAEDGTKTYKFEPSRRPTYEEMDELAENATDEMKKALVESIKLEDMGKNEYTAGIEKWATTATVVPHYAQFIDGMSEEEVINFIKNKVTYPSDIPNDKILEKFHDNKEIRELLTRGYHDLDGTKFDSIINDGNRISLIKDYITVNEDGSWSLKKSELPKWIFVDDLISLLPSECDEGEARKVFDTILKSLGKEDLNRLVSLGDHLKDKSIIQTRVGELIKENPEDSAFIEKVLSGKHNEYIPFDTILALDASKLSQDVKNTMFDKFFKENEFSLKTLNLAINRGWIKPLGNNIVEIDPNSKILYREVFTGTDDNMVLQPISRDGYQKGLDIYKDVNGAGHGSVRDKLNEDGYFTKDNIIGIITTFNNRTRAEKIIEYLNREWGPSASEMNVIPNTLLALAADKGLSSDPTYKELLALVTQYQDSTYWDYGKNEVAAKIDSLMMDLINIIEAQ